MNQEYDINDQLCTYYDMRYCRYFTRYKFKLGLSRYNEDDTLFEREEAIDDSEEIQKIEVGQEKRDDDKTKYSAISILLENVGRHIGKNNTLDNVVDEFVLNTYNEIDEQEFRVCKTLIWTLWDVKTPYYCEVVARILNSSDERRSKIFSNMKEIEDTIQRLIRKGILSQEMFYAYRIDENGNRKRQNDEPFIILPFTKDPGEALRAIGETFDQVLRSFSVPHSS